MWLSKDRKPHANRRHGMSEHPVYRVWATMINRCENPSVKSYKDYGGRGIRVCERWHVFENFLADMGLRPSDKHSIDRIDNNGNYEPGNCRWATKIEQARNSRIAVKITWNGVTDCLAGWQERTGIHWNTIARRIARGWTVEEALTRPALDKKDLYTARHGLRLIEFRGETKTLSEWARQIGISKPALATRLQFWTVEKALTKPRTK